MKRIYLDHAATTPVHPEVLNEMLPFFTERFGNPSTIYFFGREAKEGIEIAREKFAKAINADVSETVFTSGGTESDNNAIIGAVRASGRKTAHIITSKIEHHAVLETCHFLEKEGCKVTYLPVDRDGLVDPVEVKKALNKETVIVSIMFANNEIGSVQPVREIGAVCRENGVIFHTDAVQALGSLPIDVEAQNLDLLSVSAHKLYGPKGVGALYIRKGVKCSKLMHGGEQERRRRAGTENTAGIIGFGKAVELAVAALPAESKRLSALRDGMIAKLMKKIPEIKLNGHAVKRLPGNINIAVKYIEGESMLLNLDMDGICASTGSACTSGSLEPSHVLSAIGIPPELAHGSIRFSLGKSSTKEDMDFVVEKFSEIVDRLRKLSPLYKGNGCKIK